MSSTTPSPQDSPDQQPDVPERPVPSEAELLATAQPATVRRAPKFSAFIIVGALVGIVLGLVTNLVLRANVPLVAEGTGFISFLDGEGTIRLLVMLLGGVVGGFVGGALAVLADRRSTRGR